MTITAEIPARPLGARCGCMRSPDADLTGEHAVECNAPAVVECEYCGPMCAACAEETSCIFAEHKIAAVSA